MENKTKNIKILNEEIDLKRKNKLLRNKMAAREYISKLEYENIDLQKRILKINRDKDILETYIYNLKYENDLHKKYISLIINKCLYF